MSVNASYGRLETAPIATQPMGLGSDERKYDSIDLVERGVCMRPFASNNEALDVQGLPAILL
jgi:hypothetical protein